VTGLPYYQSTTPPQLNQPTPVQLTVAATARQRRVTVAFRIILAIPHMFVLYFLAIAAGVVCFLGWWGALFMGRLPDFAASYLTGYMRWTARLQAYVMLLTDMYPPFTLDDDPSYPVRIMVSQERLNRAAVFFRFILVIPADIVLNVVTLGASTIMSFIAWLITLITGQLPAPLHQAYTAALRYGTRVTCYAYLLTPTYPGGLFGDGPAADAQPPTPPQAGYGTPGYAAPGYAAPGYGAPGEPGHGGSEQSVPGQDAPGYGAPGQSTPGYGVPGYDDPAQGTPGYGDPAYGAPGYGIPGTGAPGYEAPGAAGYGAPGGAGYAGGYGAPRPAFQPADWRLALTAPAKRLVVLFVVLGVLFWGGYIALFATLIATGTNGALTAGNAFNSMNSSYNALANNLNQWQSATAACDKKLSCVTAADSTAASDFSKFASQLQATAMPSAALPYADKLLSDANKAAQDFTQLGESSSIEQYQSTTASTGLQQTLDQFDQDFNALMSKLNSI
jgi:hypothetical protein